MREAFTSAGQSVAGASRLITISKVSFMVALPQSLEMRIQAVPGVAEVTYANWFGGIYQDPKNFFANEAVAPNFFDVYSEFKLPAAELRHGRTPARARWSGRVSPASFTGRSATRSRSRRTIFPQKDG